MPLPTLQKTWQYDTNRSMIGLTSGNVSHRKLAVLIKNVLTQTVLRSHLYAQGTIDLVSGTTFRINPTGTSDTTRYNPAEVGNLVGQTVRIRGSTTAANNGDFTITAQTVVSGSVYAVEYANASGAAEAIAGSAKVIDTSKISNPWVVDHSGRDAGGAALENGTPGDGIDKHRDFNDFVMDAADFGYWVLSNPVTGTQWLLAGDATSPSNEGEAAHIAACLSPNTFQARTDPADVPLGDSIVQPDGSTPGAQAVLRAANQFWFNSIDENAAAFNAMVHLQMSDDGNHTRLLLCYDGYVTAMWCDEQVQDPTTGWSPSQVTTFITAGTTTGNGATVGLNDSAHWAGSNVTRTSVGILYAMRLFSTGEGSVSGLSGENIPVPNALNGENPLYRIGLTSNTASFQGRYGLIKDLWWGHGGLTQGEYFPADGSKQFLCVGAWVIPWDGSIAELS